MTLDLRRLGPPRRGRCGFVLLPGIEGSGETFSTLLALSQHAPVWTTDWPEGGSISALGAALAAALPAGRHVLVGASFGGLVARVVATTAPERVATLVAVGSMPGAPARPALLRVQAAALARLPMRSVARLYRRRIHSRLEEEGVGLERAAVHLSHLPGRDALVSRLRAVASWNPQKPPETLTWWLRGQSDRETTWDTRAVQAALPDASVQTVPGGHRPWLTHEGALCSLLLHLRTNALALSPG